MATSADLLIGDRLIVECEGYAAHGDKDVFERDRERFAFLRSCGYLVLNFSHKQIIDDWESVLEHRAAHHATRLARQL